MLGMGVLNARSAGSARLSGLSGLSVLPVLAVKPPTSPVPQLSQLSSMSSAIETTARGLIGSHMSRTQPGLLNQGGLLSGRPLLRAPPLPQSPANQSPGFPSIYYIFLLTGNFPTTYYNPYFFTPFANHILKSVCLKKGVVRLDADDLFLNYLTCRFYP